MKIYSNKQQYKVRRLISFKDIIILYLKKKLQQDKKESKEDILYLQQVCSCLIE